MYWQLDSIYPALTGAFEEDLRQLAHDLQVLDAKSIQIEESEGITQEQLRDYMAVLLETALLSDQLHGYVSLLLAANSEDGEALVAHEKLERLMSAGVGADARLKHRLKTCTHLAEIIQGDPLLEAHAFVLEEMRRQSVHTLSPSEETLLAKMAITGSNAFTILWQQLTTTLEVPIALPSGGTTLTLAEVRHLASDQDPHIRHLAYEAELAAYSDIEIPAAACLNGIKGEVLTVTALRGYQSPLAHTLADTRLSRPALDALLLAIREFLPEFQRYFNAKARLLGKDQLAFYDLFAPPAWETTPHYSLEASRAIVLEAFGAFSPDLHAFAREAFEKNWIDALPRPGKESGAFCSGLHRIGESRILLNHGGHLGDVITLAHELGHGYHNTFLFRESILNTQVPMVLAETASIFCEALVTESMIRQGGPEAFLALESALQDAAQVIVDIYSRYLFEAAVFEARSEEMLSPQQLKALMLDAQRTAYGSALEDTALHPYMWICKPHYYSADESFYNFPYAFGQLLAIGLYKQYCTDPEAFVPRYQGFLQGSGKKSVKAACAGMQIDCESPNFWREGLSVIRDRIDAFVAYVDAQATGAL